MYYAPVWLPETDEIMHPAQLLCTPAYEYHVSDFRLCNRATYGAPVAQVQMAPLFVYMPDSATSSCILGCFSFFNFYTSIISSTLCPGPGHKTTPKWGIKPPLKPPRVFLCPLLWGKPPLWALFALPAPCTLTGASGVETQSGTPTHGSSSCAYGGGGGLIEAFCNLGFANLGTELCSRGAIAWQAIAEYRAFGEGYTCIALMERAQHNSPYSGIWLPFEQIL